ncbi:MAG: hypothetical protein ABSA67_18500 [Candidatus Brocadiia bacterium]
MRLSKANKPLLILVLCLLGLALARTTLAGDFTVYASGDKIGFSEGNTFYPLGIDKEKFLKTFGPPDATSESYDGRYQLQYFTEGVAITVSEKTNIVWSFNFMVTPYNKYKAANVQSDKGIRRGASIRNIVVAYGQPTERTDGNLLGVTVTNLTYKMGDRGAAFEFRNGDLHTMTVYMPQKDNQQ